MFARCPPVSRIAGAQPGAVSAEETVTAGQRWTGDMTDNAMLDGSAEETAADLPTRPVRRSLIARIPSRRAAFMILALVLGVLLVATIEVLFYLYARSQLAVSSVPNLVTFLVVSG